ncbi:COX15/CtaA family protein [Pareuzebyella sediminis]|uniref:COX15/CtaA family protein n=1 Tax=Pareuzebyella sediminis TaxID=2607998 RepID=UPI0011ED83F1|nr:COX15/CtaA family protein [Pareuzebyella sediminis]
MKKYFHSAAKIALVLVYLVIAAGAVVRMTGSGMGCPDWPKCFGYYIPPTEASELEWQPLKAYKAGQVIIKDESLKVAKNDFSTGSAYIDKNWDNYTKHDYAIFNPWHTWIEFVNRLFGALAGLATLVVGILSIGYWKKNKKITIFAWLVVFAMGFQAWLGATVVYSVLEPVKITTHMIMALIIVALLLYVIYASRKNPKTFTYRKNLYVLVVITLAVSLIQIILGTQVRQFVDGQIEVVGETAKHLWLDNANWQFYTHRSFSILVILLNLFLAQIIYKNRLGFSKINWVLLLLFLEVLTGITMVYFEFPFTTQSIHLILASLLFGVQFYLVLEARNTQKSL